MKISVNGQYYSENKKEFKKILKSYNLKWSGSWANNIYIWINDSFTLQADFERENDVTTKATFEITNPEKGFVEDIQNWAGCEVESELQEINKRWTKDIEWKKRDGAPDGFIRAMEKRWKAECMEYQEK